MTTRAFDLSGQVALVTGAGRGLGYEAARLLAAAGAKIWLNGRTPQVLEDAARQIADAGAAAMPLPFDVADETAAAAAFDRIQAQDGRLDILVNNVGARDRRPLFDFETAAVERLLDTNLVAPFNLARRAAKMMIARGEGGRIVNISSIAGPISGTGDAPYTMAKAGLDGLTRALAAELGQYRITVNGVAPGFFRTDPNLKAAADPDVTAWLSRRSSLGRWGEPAELAPAVLFFASREASYVTGQVLVVDGGVLAHF